MTEIKNMEDEIVKWTREEITGKPLPDNVKLWDGPLHITGMKKPDRKNRLLKATLYIAILAFMISCLVISFLPWIGFATGVLSMVWIWVFALANGWLE